MRIRIRFHNTGAHTTILYSQQDSALDPSKVFSLKNPEILYNAKLFKLTIMRRSLVLLRSNEKKSIITINSVITINSALCSENKLFAKCLKMSPVLTFPVLFSGNYTC